MIGVFLVPVLFVLVERLRKKKPDSSDLRQHPRQEEQGTDAQDHLC